MFQLSTQVNDRDVVGVPSKIYPGLFGGYHEYIFDFLNKIFSKIYSEYTGSKLVKTIIRKKL